ncbi:TM223 protein, partial [Rhinopomastus cyanomelas]|nr:TM223 protein [Rhinopomastus cyanomelas]
RDLLLFRCDRGRFFRLAGLCCLGQGLCWALLAREAFTRLRPPPPPPAPGPGPDPDHPLRPRDQRWRLGCTGACVTIGSLLVAAGCLLPLRFIRQVTLLRGGAAVAISSHGPLGLGAGPTFTVPLRQLCGGSHRSQTAAFIPIKVKGRPFFFLLDKSGEFPHPRLFDVTVGAYRKL